MRSWTSLAFASDITSVLVAMGVARMLRASTLLPDQPWAILGHGLALVVCMIATGGYRGLHLASFQRQVETIARCVMLYAVFAGTIIAILGVGGSHWIILGSFLIPCAVFTGRIGLHRLRIRSIGRGHGVLRAAIIGTNHDPERLFARFGHAGDFGYEVVGFLSNGPFLHCDAPRLLGSMEQLDFAVFEHRLDVLFLLDWNVDDPRYHRLAEKCRSLGVGLRCVSPRAEHLVSRGRIHDIGGVSIGGPRREPRGKRALDLLCGALIFLATAPLTCLIALAIRLDSPGPILFRQRRVTRGGREFDMFKFRTMIEDAEHLQSDLSSENEAGGPIFKIRRDPRITRVGRWLRRSSLDELPQVLNVLQGDMSLVGPRPPLPKEVARYESWQKRRLEGAQGITGLWQVSGRSDLDFEEMVLLDLYYLEHQSVLFDLELLLGTIPAVLLGRGAY